MLKNGTATHKIPGGKLVRVDVSYDANAIHSVKITGDFFLHPEEVFEVIVELCATTLLPLNKEKLVKEISKLLEDNQAALIGADPIDLVNTLEEAVS